jgi:N-acetylglucosaminyldiphosphoundecaprenol N-acetyl-beta-D-mannosaminyltransferase
MRNYSVYCEKLSEMPIADQIMINTLNQYSYCLAESDAIFKKALVASDILLPDGIAIVAAMRLLTGRKIKKVAGADLHQHILSDLNAKGGSCFYLGASDETLLKIKVRVAQEFPSISVSTFSPPFKAQFSNEDNQEIIGRINAVKPDVVFVGMTAPKQEKWAYAHKKELDTKMICCIGAVFDFYAGTVIRPNAVWIGLGLEWLGRLVKEPKRMWKRYLLYGPVFLWHIAKVTIDKKSSSQED